MTNVPDEVLSAYHEGADQFNESLMEWIDGLREAMHSEEWVKVMAILAIAEQVRALRWEIRDFKT